jgi:trans-2,3-dihydro-3-hydroxyanthranilate isomerase
MAGYQFVQLDVFTARRFGGNALAVFPQAAGLSDATMQAVARETNLSETTFITGGDPVARRFDVRIFTPLREVPFAGHPTVGTAWQLFRTVAADAAELTLALRAGDVTVRRDAAVSPELVWFKPPPIEFGPLLEDTGRLAGLYGVAPAAFDLACAPAQFVNAGPGMTFLIAPFADRDALEQCEANVAALRRLEQDHGCALLTAFCRGGYAEGSTFSTRMFAPLHGVPEDPATGSSASALSAYLRHHGLIGDCGEEWVGLDQGYSVARPSLIRLRANLDAATGDITVNIGGHVVHAASGIYEI